MTQQGNNHCRPGKNKRCVILGHTVHGTVYQQHYKRDKANCKMFKSRIKTVLSVGMVS